MSLVLAFICLFALAGCKSIASLDIFAHTESEMDVLAREYADLLEMIEELFIGEFDIHEIHTEAMRALVEALDDEWSFYMTQEEFDLFVHRATNSYYGIGVDVHIDPDAPGVEILRVHRNSPAELGGILPGDIMTYIDGQSVRGVTLQEVRTMLARPLGEFAEITVIRYEEDNVTLTIMYTEIILEPIRFELIEDDIGFVNLFNFDTHSADAFKNAVEDLIAMGAKSFIFDMRFNSGGSVREMTEILDFLLPEGEIFVHVDRNGVERITESGEEWLDMPAVVLVNRYSFSAAEYFAAILSEFGYAQVVGEQTSGKNRSQTTHLLPDSGALHISTGQYLTKNRVNLRDIGGFTPDYVIEHTDDELELLLFDNLDMSDDPHMQKAISLLRE
jgi:carboxyl-terminal processing protease